ncbi:MCE family protein [Gordonia soli]|uniref:Mce family protein n=1 Tax=Gordonia soli NBRC 108243 TaxID=1223545 RepID=M0QRA6_9ACTN|nr:MCE family protein [Gordonia soli]GAC70002.1 Mce family protein [Gordonia soli NBRC 108243]
MLSRGMGRIRSTLAATAVALGVVVGVSGCSILPASVSSAFGSTITVSAFFDSVAGLYESNDVAVLGMPVGQVTKVEPQGNRVKVTFTVDNDVPIPANATAAIVNTSIVTTRHIELSPTYSEGAKLTDGSVITETKAPVSIDELFDSIDGLVKSLSGTRPGEGPVADMVDITAGIASGNGERMQEAINELSKASQVVSRNGDGLVEIIKAIQKLTTRLVDNYPKMKAFSSSINQVSQILQRQSPGLVATLGNLNTTLQNTTEFLRNNSGTIGASTGRLAALAENLSDYSRQVVETVDVGPLLFQNLSNSVSAETRAWRAQVLLDKSLLDNELVSKFCQAINLQADGCRTGQLKDFGPDLGVFNGLLELSK